LKKRIKGNARNGITGLSVQRADTRPAQAIDVTGQIGGGDVGYGVVVGWDADEVVMALVGAVEPDVLEGV
jgi:hypothetical protein